MPQRSRSVESATADPASPAPPGILVVDDDSLVRNFLLTWLRSEGFAASVVASGPEAVERYRANPDAIGLVMLDVQMPGLDGPNTFAVLRGLNPDLRCCFMSGDTGPYTPEELLNDGAACLFRKPFDLPEVARALQVLLRR